MHSTVTTPQERNENMKATFKESYFTKDGKYLVYEYRGYEYTIIDYGYIGLFPYGETIPEQHRKEQSRIDGIIWSKEHPTNCTMDANECFNFFWDYVEGNIDIDED